MEAAEREIKLDSIRKFVLQERKKLGIKRLKGPLPELSCETFGEFHNLLWRSLLHAHEEEWFELKDDAVLDGVYREVLSNTR